MEKYKFLYKKMYDDLKDSEMLIDYAYCLKEDEESDIARYFIDAAAFRLSKSFKEAHALFTSHAQAEKELKNEIHTVSNCLWDEQHTLMAEWYDGLVKKVEKYK